MANTSKHLLRSLPGHLAVVISTVAGSFLGFVQLMSFFYEGWGQPLGVALAFLAPPVALVVAFLFALRWPRTGGWTLLVAGLAAAAWWMWRQAGPQGLSVETLVTVIVMVGPVVVVAGFFLLEARHRTALAAEGVKLPAAWLARNYRYVLVGGIPLLAALITVAAQLPERLARLDDGLRGVRVIEGNGVRLAWAPRGPGWNWQQADSGYPSWNMLATYGVSPVGFKAEGDIGSQGASVDAMARTGLCGYLNDEGSALLAEPANIWRLPTADEVVRSLTRNGRHAGCTWDRQAHHAACAVPPDKETPLWAPDEAPIYYWTADAPEAPYAVGINYTGGVTYHRKSAGGVGFRCVKPAT